MLNLSTLCLKFNERSIVQDMNVEVSPTERSLLGFVVAKIQKIDPDVLVVSNFYRYLGKRAEDRCKA